MKDRNAGAFTLYYKSFGKKFRVGEVLIKLNIFFTEVFVFQVLIMQPTLAIF